MGVVANAPLVVAPAMATNGYFALKTSGWMTWRSQLSLSLLSSLGYVALVAFLAKRGSLARLIRALPVSYLVGVGFGLLMFLAHLGLLDESGMGVVGCGGAEASPTLSSSKRPDLILAALVLVAVVVGDVRRPDKKHVVVLAATVCGALAAAVARAAAGDAVFESKDRHGGVRFYGMRFPGTWTGAQWAAALWTALGYVTGKIFDILASVFLVVFVLLGFHEAPKRTGAGAVDALGPDKFRDYVASTPKLQKIILVDGAAWVFGSLLGCAPMTCFVESAVGIAAGAAPARFERRLRGRIDPS